MAVYEHTYKRYADELTPQRWRFLVLPRYAFKTVFQSKLLVFYYALGFLLPLVLLAFAVAYHRFIATEAVRNLLGSEFLDFIKIGPDTFHFFLYFQGVYAVILTLLVGPGLISQDLLNNGLPLYLSRPLSRSEYVLGKSCVLAVLLSLVTWIPGTAIYFLNGSLVGGSWIGDNLRILIGVFVGSWLLIALLSLLSMALSAWVKWRAVAAFMILVIPLFGFFFGKILTGFLHTPWGHIFNAPYLLYVVWGWFLGAGLDPDDPPLLAALIGLAAYPLFSLLLLHWKLRAYEVVR